MLHVLVAALSACAPTTVAPELLSVEVSEEIGTVVTVSWATPEPAMSWVEYGPTEAFGASSPVSATAETTHTQALLGLTADTDWYVRVVAEVDGRRAESPTRRVRTLPLPSDVPPVVSEIVPGLERPWGQYTLFTWFVTAESASVVLVANRDGEVVWYWSVEGQCLSAAFSRDRTAVVLLVSGTNGIAYIERVPLAGGASVTIDAHRAHHDFVEREDGYSFIAGEARDIDGVSVTGDRIVEVSATGESREVWNAFDHLPVEENDGWAQDPADWTHANGMDYDEETGLYLLSLFRQEQVLAIDAATGETVWTLGEGGDFTFVDDPGFGPQHAPKFVGGDVLLFDNAWDADVSRLVAYTLDTTTWTARPSWSLASPAGERSVVMGDGDRLPGGGTVSTWGERPLVITTNEVGEVVRTLTVGTDPGVLGHVDRVDSLYPL